MNFVLHFFSRILSLRMETMKMTIFLGELLVVLPKLLSCLLYDTMVRTNAKNVFAFAQNLNFFFAFDGGSGGGGGGNQRR